MHAPPDVRQARHPLGLGEHTRLLGTHLVRQHQHSHLSKRGGGGVEEGGGSEVVSERQRPFAAGAAGERGRHAHHMHRMHHTHETHICEHVDSKVAAQSSEAVVRDDGLPTLRLWVRLRVHAEQTLHLRQVHTVQPAVDQHSILCICVGEGSTGLGVGSSPHNDRWAQVIMTGSKTGSWDYFGNA